MASESGRTSLDVERDLVESGAAYDFFQAVRLIGLLGKQKGNGANTGSCHKLTIRPELSFNYPASDIAEIQRLDEDAGFSITTTFMGLYGVSSPLPAHFTEELLDDEWDEVGASRGFLDIIHQHLYPLLYRAWLKCKFSHNAVENRDESYWDILYSLIGLGTGEIKAGVDQRQFLLRYVGLLSQQRKSTLGLETILRDYLYPLPVEIEQCVTRMVSIPAQQKLQLGERQCTLGDSAVLGQEVLDRTGKMAVRIGPLSREEYRELAGDKRRIEFIRFIIRLYLVQPLDFDVVLTLAPDTLPGVSLGEDAWSCLGVDTWLYAQGNTEEVDIVMGNP